MDAVFTATLRDTYLHAFRVNGTYPTDVVDNVEAVTNVRFARELLGVLDRLSLVTEEEVDNDTVQGYIWQPVLSPDSATDEDAEQEFDAVLAQALTADLNDTPHVPTNPTDDPAPAAPTTKRDPNPANLPSCLCGCGTVIQSRKGMYRPGHDARHAGNIGRALMEAGRIDSDLLEKLPTDKLRDKAIAMFNKNNERKVTKVQAAQAKEPQVAPEPEPTDDVEGVVKVGRVEYPAKRHPDGSITRCTTKDGKGKYVSVDDKVFSTFRKA